MMVQKLPGEPVREGGLVRVDGCFRGGWEVMEGWGEGGRSEWGERGRGEGEMRGGREEE